MSFYREEQEATINAVRKIRDILSSATIGWANESAKRQIQEIISGIHCNAMDPYVREKAGDIATRIEDLFSARKWQKYGGADVVLREILVSCKNMTDRAQTLLSKADHEV